MRRNRKYTGLVTVVICAGLWARGVSAPVRAAVTYRDESHHFSFGLPDGWEQTSQADIRTVMEALSQQTVFKAKDLYSAAFHRVGAGNFEYPYILVQTQKTTLGSYDEIEKAIRGHTSEKGVNEATKSLRAMLSAARASDVRLDRAHNLYSFRMDSEVENVGTLYGEALNFFGKNSLVGVYLYDTRHPSQVVDSARAALIDSFSYDAGYRYDLAKAATSGKSLSGVTKAALRGGLLGMLLGAAAGLVLLSMRKRRQKQTAGTPKPASSKVNSERKAHE